MVDGKNDPNLRNTTQWTPYQLRMAQKADEDDKDAWKKILPDLSMDIRSDELKKKK